MGKQEPSVMKRRILFVDDEPNVLDGLRRMLRPMCRQWDMTFAQSGQEALEALAKRSFDVVVSDMRMPEIDGAELLTEIRRRHPQMVRIVLSGYSSEGMALRLVGTAHQYVAKPCDPERLKEIINRAFALRELLHDESLKQLLSCVKSLPSLPSLYAEVIEELRNPDASISKVAEIVSKDPGMTAKILQLVNSAFFGLPRHVSSPAQAAALLGVDTIQALVLSVNIFSAFKESDIHGFELESLWTHSTETAALAKRIAMAQTAKRETVGDALTAALLHDIGKLVLAQNLPTLCQEAMTRAHENEVAHLETEREVFGATHGEVGAYLLGLWGLPDPIVEAVAFHHQPAKAMGKSFSPLTAVHVANALEHDRHAEHRENKLNQLDINYLASVGLTDRIPAWRDICENVLNKGNGR